jgi:alpha-mannosidase
MRPSHLVRSLVVAMSCHASVTADTVTVTEEIPAALIEPSASTTFGEDQRPAHLIDGSGLKDDRHDNAENGQTMWHSAVNPPETEIGAIKAKSWLRFDFKQPQSVGQIMIWNHNQNQLTNRGFRRTRILATEDGMKWGEVASLELPKADGEFAAATVVEIPSQRPFKAIAIAAQSNWGGNVYGLSEVRFITVRRLSSSELPFPDKLEAEPSPIYRFSEDRAALREIVVRFGGAKLYQNAELKVSAAGKSVVFPVPANARGTASARILLPAGVAADEPGEVEVELKAGGKNLKSSLTIPAQRKWTVYIYPHSHVDIGYTNTQSNVEIIHKRNVVQGIRLAKETAAYPEGARYVWNPEVTWPVERYMQTATGAQKEEVYDAIRKGYLSIDAGYINDNTSITADEEFPSLFGYAKELEKHTGVKIDTLVQVDVPGMSWGAVPMAVQHGIRYAFLPINGGDRTGLAPEANFRPFWWVGPDGESKILFLQPGDYTPGARAKGRFYWPSMAGQRDPDKLLQIVKTDHPRDNFIDDYLWPTLKILEADKDYPYDIFPMTWAMADNTPIDADLPEAVKSWNEEYAWPHLVIAGASTIMHAFEQKYGDRIPVQAGDFTEYWTDGLGSAAAMTGMNRHSKERLIQADTLWSMLRPGEGAPRAEITEAWRNVLMGSEHTWCFMDPNQADMQNEIWASKQGHFKTADRMSRSLLAAAADKVTRKDASGIVVFNTLSWDRSGLVLLSPEQSRAGDRVVERGTKRPAPSQRLSTGELAFLSANVASFSAANFLVESGAAVAPEADVCKAGPDTLENARLRLRLDPATGDIVSFVDRKTGTEWVDPKASCGLNSYRYLLGQGQPASAGPQYNTNATDESGKPISEAKASGPTDVTIRIKEHGPLVSSLLVESKAEGCHKLLREIRLVAGMPHVEIDNLVDKIATTTKEGIHFGFAFKIDAPRVRADIPWGVMETEVDQLPYANRNWLCFQRWLNVSGGGRGVTWCSLDSSLFEQGAMSANIIGSGWRSPAWLRRLPPSGTIYSWALNNHWHTNFPLSQEGQIPFRYRILPHETEYDPVASNRFGLEQAQPLIATTVAEKIDLTPLVAVDNPKVYVTIVKASGDGKSAVVRLRSLSDKKEIVRVSYPAGTPRAAHFSDASETLGQPVEGPIPMRRYGVVTLKLDLGKD